MKTALGSAFLCLAPFAGAGTFVEDFTGGARTQHWSIQSTHTGVYGYDFGGDRLNFYKIGNNPANLTNMGLYLDLASVGGNLTGDFAAGVDLVAAVFGGTALNQIEFQTSYANGGICFLVYDNGGGLNCHVWNGSHLGNVPVSGPGSRMTLTRVGSTITARYGSTVIGTMTNSSALTSIRMVIQNNTGSNNAISCSYDNFSLAGVATRVSGTVDLQGFVGDPRSVMATVSLRPVNSGGGQSSTVPLDAQGRFEVYTRLTGQYVVEVKPTHWLTSTSAPFTLGSTDVGGVDVSCINGDCDGDDDVDIDDYDVLANEYGSFGFELQADLDGDGDVDIDDYDILAGSYGLPE